MTTEAPTAKAAMDTLRKERDKWKARAELLEEKLSDATSERDICRTQLSDALASLKGAQQSRSEDSDDEVMWGSKMQHDSEDDSEDDSESSSDSSESSDSSPDRKRKKKGKGKRKKSGKKRKNKKEKKAKKSKHRSRQRVGGPGDVVKRYKKVLAIFQTGKNMAKSFEKYGVDRLTIVKTAAIAELAIAAPEEYDQLEKGGTVGSSCA
ncbi:coiled-coil domain-containing protein 106-like [Sparus aurata]|uniref:coiled-coil domain-containing protein 106-like n=1 Tax=Sparus aurata TaxID=8175 RepID=UPI0011C1CBD3|nr:coiled-coil domain-containing protein 106-like [Sparus aurata]